MVERTSYKSLCTAFYDTDKPIASSSEVEFYAHYLQGHSSILEAMCGSGRLMIPLLERGFEVEGIDSSTEMLASLSARLQQKNLSATFYEGDVLHYPSPKKYSAIIVAVGSFQLIIDLNQALAVLKKFYQLLLPNGFIIIDTFIPWEALQKADEPDISHRTISLDTKSKIEMHSNCIADVKKQIYIAKTYIRNITTIRLSMRSMKAFLFDGIMNMN